jgi:hypothetical protein
MVRTMEDKDLKKDKMMETMKKFLLSKLTNKNKSEIKGLKDLRETVKRSSMFKNVMIKVE